MKDEQVPHLIIGYLQGTLTKEETNLFYAWVDENEENKILFFESKNIFDASVSYNQVTDINESWQRLLQKKRKQTLQPYTIWYRIGGYAAVGLIAVFLTSLFFFHRTQPEGIAAKYIGGNGLEADAVELPDGTRVNLGTQTTFHYETDYGKSRRIVYLEGEAYFDVAKQKNKPFIVKVNGQEIEALGTKFNVMAYREDSLLITTLLEGSVRLTTDNITQKTTLEPNQQLIYNRNTQLTQVYKTDAQQFTAWTSGYYYFPEQSLKAILQRLSNVYGIECIVQSERLNKRIFTGTFYRGQNVKDIMEIINISIPIKYKIEGRQVTIWE